VSGSVVAFEKICTLDDIWEGDIAGFETSDGTEVLLAYPDGGELKAFQNICPHQHFELSDGTLDDNVLTCPAHLWQFDLHTGKGVNPADCALANYPLKLDGDDVYVDVDGVELLHSHT
jgi:toluene monooxygenase system ferredoxin subunit